MGQHNIRSSKEHGSWHTLISCFTENNFVADQASQLLFGKHDLHEKISLLHFAGNKKARSRVMKIPARHVITYQQGKL